MFRPTSHHLLNIPARAFANSCHGLPPQSTITPPTVRILPSSAPAVSRWSQAAAPTEPSGKSSIRHNPHSGSGRSSTVHRTSSHRAHGWPAARLAARVPRAARASTAATARRVAGWAVAAAVAARAAMAAALAVPAAVAWLGMPEALAAVTRVAGRAAAAARAGTWQQSRSHCSPIRSNG